MNSLFTRAMQAIKSSFRRAWPRLPFWVWFALALVYAIVAQMRQA